MASEPETRTANTTVERMQLVGEWLEYLSGAQGSAKGFIVFQSPTDRYVQFEFDRRRASVHVEVGTFEWQKELGGALPERAEERLVRKEFNAPDRGHLNYWQDIDRPRSRALSSTADWVFRDIFEEPADFRLSVGRFGVDASQPVHVQPAEPAHPRGGVSDGAQDYDEAIRLQPEDADAYFNRGSAYSDIGQFQLAIQDYDEAIRLNPEHADGFIQRAYDYSTLGQFERALEDYNEAIRLDPEDAEAYAQRAIVHVFLGMETEAVEDVDRAVSLGADRATLETQLQQAAHYGGLSGPPSTKGRLSRLWRSWNFTF